MTRIYSRTDHKIRVISWATGAVTTLAGGSSGFQDGYESNAKFNNPYGLTAIPNTRRHNTPTARVVTSAGGCGEDLVSSAATCQQLANLLPGKTWSGTTYHSSSRPRGCFAYGSSIYYNSYASDLSCSASYQCICQEDDHGDILLVSDYSNHRVRIIRTDVALVTTFAGDSSSGFTDGVGSSARFNNPGAITYMPGSGMAVLVDSANGKVRTLTSGACTGPITCPGRSIHPEWYDYESIHPTWIDASNAGSSLLVSRTVTFWV